MTEAAWERVRQEKAAEIAELVRNRTLEGRRKGRGVMVQAGSFYDWLGEEAPVYPDWGLEFDVLPDGEAEKVERLRKARRRAWDALRECPYGGDLIEDMAPPGASVDAGGRARGDQLVETLSERIRGELGERWQELVVAETVIDEVTPEFDGEDPIKPQVRELMVDVRSALEEIAEEVRHRLGPVDLGEPEGERLDELREVGRQPRFE